MYFGQRGHYSFGVTEMYTNYNIIVKQIDELIEFLKLKGIEPDFNSPLEDDYLSINEYYELYKENPYSKNLPNKGKIAMGGLYELCK